MTNNKIGIILIFTILILCCLTTISHANLYLNNLDFKAEIDNNGNMNVVETWDIKISDTNTLFKTFNIDKTRYSGITNVNVEEVDKGNFTKTDTWAYHLTKNYFYGGMNNTNEFEICWGVGLDNSSETKTYKISYTVLDAVKKYNDCTELYWQFLGEDFEIDAQKITGTIKLPNSALSKEDIKVWGHVETLNGEIHATSNDTVEFWLDNYKGKNYVEIRIAMPNNLITNVNRIENIDYLDSIIAEETKWAEEANARRLRKERINKILTVLLGIATVFIDIFSIKKIIKNIKLLKQTEKAKSTQELDYFREMPNKESTPGDALFLYNKGRFIGYTEFGNIFSSTLLYLALKKCLKIEVNKDEKGKEQVIISKTNIEFDNMGYETERIINYIYKAMGKADSITVKELQKYIKTHPTGVSSLIEGTTKNIKSKNITNKNYDEQNANKKTKYINTATLCIIGFTITLFFIPISVPLLVNAIIMILLNRKISTLTQKGLDEREQWKGLKKYMEDFSLLNEKEVPAIDVWEEYLVYATVFGIADKVIKQLKIVYPNFEEMSNLNTASCIHLMSNTNFNSSFSGAISSSISSTMSSASGGGGGFSSGGGGGRWRTAAVAGR